MGLDDFIRHIFSDVNQDEAIVTVSAEEGFRARRWRPGHAPPSSQLYFCISTVRDVPRQQILPRQTDDLVKTYVIVLDDIGTKVDQSRIKVQPTYKLETSSGNYQWGYRLTYGANPARAAALIEGIAAAVLTDMGSRRADRIMRVPGSVNLNHGEPFHARLQEAEWSRSWTLSELEVALGVQSVEPRAALSEPRTLEEGQTDPVFDWLMAQGMVIQGPNPRGWFAIHCPWEEEHSGDVDHGTDYMPGSPGAFKCMHGHCAQRGTADLRAWIEHEDPGARLGPVAAVQPSLEGLARALKTVLQAQPAGTMFSAPLPEEGPVSAARRLARAIEHIPLGPHILPDPDVTANGNLSSRQPTSTARVHAVMDAIGMTARLNVVSWDMEVQVAGVDIEARTEDMVDLLLHACQRCGMRDQEGVRNALAAYAAEHRYHPVLQWMDSAPWDGVDRIQALCDTIVMRDKEMEPWRNIAVRRWLKQAYVAITNWITEPAADVGYCLVLQSNRQRKGKSKWFVEAVLPTQWTLGDVSLNLDSNERDSVRRATKACIVELAELDSTFKKSDVSKLKNFLTTRVDIWRAPYGRSETRRPRTTVFGATVNQHDFLADTTGSSRFWVLAVSHTKWDHDIDKQQLWAQVEHEYDVDDRYWLSDEEAALQEAAAEEHQTDTDALHIARDLDRRREGKEQDDTWVHADARDLLEAYRLKNDKQNRSELKDVLGRLDWVRAAKVRGKRGWWVPNFRIALSAAQRSALTTIVGGKDANGKKR